MTGGGEIVLRIILVAPPTGALFCLQRGKDDLVHAVRSTGRNLAFDFPVKLRGRDGAPDFGGPFVQGRPGARFIYVNSGKRAGEADSTCDRRAKVPLSGITRVLIEQVRSTTHSVLEARIAGTAKDGGPACASVALVDGSWHIAAR